MRYTFSTHERTEGVRLFVKELAGALALRGRLLLSEAGVELAPGVDLPMPDTLRDAVLLRLDGLPDPALQLLHVAVVAGREFDLALVAELVGSADGFDVLLERGLTVEAEPGRGAFRHALTRANRYFDTALACPWQPPISGGIILLETLVHDLPWLL